MAVDPAAILRRLERMKTARAVVETDIRDCYRYTDPARGAPFESIGTVATDQGVSAFSNAANKKAELLTDVGTDAVRIAASALMSGATPANSLWFGLDVPGATDADKRWLEASAQTLWENIHASNYDAVGFDCMYDYLIAGQFALFVDEAKDGGYRFEQWPLANTYFASSRLGEPVDTVISEIALTAEQAVKEYEEHMVSEKVRQAYRDGNYEQQFTFVRAIYPRMGPHGQLARNLPIASCHIEKDSRKVVRESGYHEMPIGVPRWKLLTGSHYALGLVYDALPSLRTLNKALEMVLANMDLAVAGMWIAEDDGVLNPRTVRVGPRKIVVANSVDSMKPLQPAAKFEAAFLQIEALERQIRRTLMADQLTPQNEGPQMTATEVAVRVELIRQLLGPVYGRMQAEYLQWLVMRCFGLAYRAGAFGPAPPSLRDKVLSIRYVSPIARAQRALEVAAMDRYEMALAQEAAVKPEVLDNYDWDEAARLRAELLGVPQKLIVEPDARDAQRQARAAQQQQAAQAQMMAGAMGKMMEAA